MSFTDLEAVLKEIENCVQPLLTVNNLSHGPPGLRIDILTHVNLRDRLTPDDCIHQIGPRLVAPHVAALKFRLKHKLMTRIPFLEVADAVYSGPQNSDQAMS
jgi:hypothetical protein